MRILITTDVVGGVWRYTTTLAGQLVARGHTCAVGVIGERDEARLAELPEGVDVFWHVARLEWMPGGLEDAETTAAWLRDVVAEWGPDVVHLNQFVYARQALPTPVVVVAHSDVYSWFEEVKGEHPPAEWSAYRDAVRSGIAAADVVVAPTGYQSGRLARHYGQTAVRVIHNGIEPPQPDPSLPPASERSLVLVAGRAWDAAKGIELLDEAVAELTAELGSESPAVHLVGPLEGPAGEEASTPHLETHGEVEASAMDRFYRNARLYVGPSLYEPFGLSPLEAAGHGCGLLLSGIGSFRELWTGAAGFFEPLHADVLARRLRATLADPAGLDAMAAGARERARTRYTAGRMADQYVALYEGLTRARPGTGSVPTAGTLHPES